MLLLHDECDQRCHLQSLCFVRLARGRITASALHALLSWHPLQHVLTLLPMAVSNVEASDQLVYRPVSLLTALTLLCGSSL